MIGGDDDQRAVVQAELQPERQAQPHPTIAIGKSSRKLSRKDRAASFETVKTALRTALESENVQVLEHAITFADDAQGELH